MKQPLAIVGSGLAGVRAAQTLRANGYSDRIILVGEEALPPCTWRRNPRSWEYVSRER